MAASTPKPLLSEKRMRFLKTTNLAGMIRLSNIFVPRLVRGLLPKLSERQLRAIDKIMPVGGQKKIYFHLCGTPTPPVVVTLAQPPAIGVMSEDEIRKNRIKGIDVDIDSLPALLDSIAAGQGVFDALRSLKGQKLAVLSLMSTFSPLILLGPAELKDLGERTRAHFKPLTSMFIS